MSLPPDQLRFYHHYKPPPPPPSQQQQEEEEDQQQSPSFDNFLAADGQMTVPITFVDSGFPNQTPAQCPPSFVHAIGLAPGSVDVDSSRWGEPPRKMFKEHLFLGDSQNSTVDVPQTTGSVATGLELSSSVNSPIFPHFGDEIDLELQRQDAEMDRFLKIQCERMRQAILDKVQADQVQTLATVEEKILRKLREKDADIEDMNKKNLELEDQMRQLTAEASAWQNHAKYNENMIMVLKHNLQQVFAQGDDNKEGHGDSEVDDTASCCNRDGIGFNIIGKESRVPEGTLTCKVCRGSEVCMLLLPCRHACLCKDCESKLNVCPLCQTSKFIGMEIYI